MKTLGHPGPKPFGVLNTALVFGLVAFQIMDQVNHRLRFIHHQTNTT